MAASNEETARRRQDHVPSNCHVVWLDAMIGKSKDSKSLETELRQTVTTLHTFTKVEDFFDFITSCAEDSVLIISGSFGQELITRICKLEKVKQVLIFCGDYTKHEHWARQYTIIKGVFVKQADLLNKLKELQQSSMISINFVKPPLSGAEERKKNSMLWFPIFVQILFRIPPQRTEIHDFADFCRQQYTNNSTELAIIKEFERDYSDKCAVWWYTRECFLYPMLNKALRTFDIDVLLKMRFFIGDLHKQITAGHEHLLETMPPNQKIGVVFRGQGMAADGYDKICANKGCLMAFNVMLSTSADRSMCLHFAQGSANNADLKGVLFQITFSIKQSLCMRAEELSYFPNEKEVLFSMNHVFRIDSIEEMSDRVGLVRLVLTEEEGKSLRQLTDYYMKYEIEDLNPNLALATLLHEINKDDDAIVLYEKSLQELSSNHEDVPFILINLALLNISSPDIALKYCERALLAAQKNLPNGHATFARIHMIFGKVLMATGSAHQIMVHFQKALEIAVNVVLPTHPMIPRIHDLIGDVHFQNKDLKNSLKHYECAQRLREPPSMPRHHPERAVSLEKIGDVYARMTDFQKALNNYQRAKELLMKTEDYTAQASIEVERKIEEMQQKLE